MELTIKGVIIKSLDDIQIFPILVKDETYMIVKKRLELEYENALKILRKLKEEGVIKMVEIPKNKKIQKELDFLKKAKKTIKESLNKLTMFT